MSTYYRIATKAVRPNDGFTAECWILGSDRQKEGATIVRVAPTEAENELEAEYHSLLAALRKAIEFCEGRAWRHSLEIVPQHQDIAYQLLNPDAIDSVAVYHLRAKAFELMSKFQFVCLVCKEQ